MATSMATGLDDLVMAVTSGASQGNLTSARLLTLTRAAANQPLRVVGTFE